MKNNWAGIETSNKTNRPEVTEKLAKKGQTKISTLKTDKKRPVVLENSTNSTKQTEPSGVEKDGKKIDGKYRWEIDEEKIDWNNQATEG